MQTAEDGQPGLADGRQAVENGGQDVRVGICMGHVPNVTRPTRNRLGASIRLSLLAYPNTYTVLRILPHPNHHHRVHSVRHLYIPPLPEVLETKNPEFYRALCILSRDVRPSDFSKVLGKTSHPIRILFPRSHRSRQRRVFNQCGVVFRPMPRYEATSVSRS